MTLFVENLKNKNRLLVELFEMEMLGEKNMEQNKKQTGDKPVHKIRVGNVTATIWKKKVETKFGEKDMFSTTIVKNYKSEDEWKQTSSFNLEDLPKVVLCSNKAYEYIALKEIDEE